MCSYPGRRRKEHPMPATTETRALQLPEAGFVSTGHLPPGIAITRWDKEAYEQFRSNTDGEVSQVYPALARVRPDLFGISVVSTSGETYDAGDAEDEFTIM